MGHFDVLRILKTCKFPQGGMSEHDHEHGFSPQHDHGFIPIKSLARRASDVQLAVYDYDARTRFFLHHDHEP
jgi:hypothetical protein